ncbi:hypothetical protein BTM240_10290 [Helicobacter pylori]
MFYWKDTLQIDFSQIDMKTQNKRKTMIELILDKKSIQIDEEFLDIALIKIDGLISFFTQSTQ